MIYKEDQQMPITLNYIDTFKPKIRLRSTITKLTNHLIVEKIVMNNIQVK